MSWQMILNTGLPERNVCTLLIPGSDLNECPIFCYLSDTNTSLKFTKEYEPLVIFTLYPFLLIEVKCFLL